MAEAPKSGGAPRQNKTIKQFAGMNTQNERNAIPEGQFHWLENVQPIGPGNLHSIPGRSTSVFRVPPDVPPPPGCTDLTIRGQSQHSFIIDLAFDIAGTEGPLTSIREAWSRIHNGELYALVGNSICGGGNMWYTNECCQIAHFKNDNPTAFEILPLPVQIVEAYFNTRMGNSDEFTWASASGSATGLKVAYDLGNRILNYPIDVNNSCYAIREGSVWIWNSIDGHVYVFTTTDATVGTNYLLGEQITAMGLTADQLIAFSNGTFADSGDRNLIYMDRATGTIIKKISIRNLNVGSVAVVADDLVYLLTAGAHPVLYYCDGNEIIYIGYCTNTDAPTIGPAWFDSGTFYFNKGYDVWKIAVDCPPEGGPIPVTLSTDAVTVAPGDTVNVTWNNLLVTEPGDAILLNPYHGPSNPISWPGSGNAPVASKTIGPAVSGTTTFTIPLSAPAGDYIFQMSPWIPTAVWAGNSNVFTVT